MARHLQGRSVFATGSKLLGFCDNRVQEGDQLYLLAGGRIPFVLRPVPESASPSHFNLIGGAIVQGIMLGNAWDRKTDIEDRETIVLV